MNPDILHQARVAAVIQKKTLGQWLEEAIVEKVGREQKPKKRHEDENSVLRQSQHG